MESLIRIPESDIPTPPVFVSVAIHTRNIEVDVNI